MLPASDMLFTIIQQEQSKEIENIHQIGWTLFFTKFMALSTFLFKYT